MKINSVLSFFLALMLLCGCEDAKCPRCGQPMNDGKCGNCVATTDSLDVGDVSVVDEETYNEFDRTMAHSLYVQGAQFADTSDNRVIWEKALPLLLKSAQMGYDSAQCLLGVTLLHVGGNISNADKETYNSAIYWLNEAVDNGNDEALYYIAECYDYGQGGVEQDFEEAFKWYMKAALRGNKDAQFSLGYMYHLGEGVEKNETESFKWYRKAAEQGIAGAQYVVAECYETGSGVEKNETEAFKWYRKAAEQYDTDAHWKVASCYLAGKWGVKKDTLEALKFLYRAARNNHADAIEKLVTCCVERENVVIDSSICSGLENSVKVSADSLNQLGVEYEGKGDFSNAYVYYKMAAEKGMPKSQNSLAQCYLRKRPVKEIYLQKAFIWFTSSANLGDVLGQYNLGLCYYFGTGTDVNYEMAVKWFEKSAEQGYVDAQYNIGVCYSKGQGVPSSCVEAYKWYKKAADGGHADAIRIVGMMKNNSCPLINF